MKFIVFRYNPDVDATPRMQEHEVAASRGMMLRDALMEIKRQDETFSFRHSCGEGVCGSDGVQECRYLVKDFGTSQSPKSTRQRDSRYCP
ncbi:MAG: 2Fe-2S iron-sulfur cluster-binding protein, partial [Candidatus Sedimenticola endophacoides]